jgi:hypothetical protein
LAPSSAPSQKSTPKHLMLRRYCSKNKYCSRQTAIKQHAHFSLDRNSYSLKCFCPHMIWVKEGGAMIEIAGGILLALLVLLCVSFLLRSIAWLIPIGTLLLIGAFFIGTEFGRTLLPVVLAAGILGAVVWAISKGLDHRDARAKSGRPMSGR